MVKISRLGSPSGSRSRRWRKFGGDSACRESWRWIVTIVLDKTVVVFGERDSIATRGLLALLFAFIKHGNVREWIVEVFFVAIHIAQVGPFRRCLPLRLG